MIRNDKEYQRTRELVATTRDQIEQTSRDLAQQGFGQAEIDNLLVSLSLTCQQMDSELSWYENAKAHRLGPCELEDIGQLLIGLRIAMGLSQRELASRLSVHESVVSRDEHHDYYGLTLDRAGRILDALGASVSLMPKYSTCQGDQVYQTLLPAQPGCYCQAGLAQNTMAFYVSSVEMPSDVAAAGVGTAGKIVTTRDDKKSESNIGGADTGGSGARQLAYAA